MDDYAFEATLTDVEFADYAAHMDKHAPGWRERQRAQAIRELEDEWAALLVWLLAPRRFTEDYLDRQLDVFGRTRDDMESAGVM